MSKPTTVQETPAGEKDQQQQQKTKTKWKALSEASLVPTEIVCMGYKPYHKVDLGCHTRLGGGPKQIKSHIEAEHGGGFRMSLRKADRGWKGWAECEELGLEAMDFRCEICDAVVPFHPTHILKHMRPHSGKTRRVLPGGVFNITLSVGYQMPSEEEAFEEEWAS